MESIIDLFVLFILCDKCHNNKYAQREIKIQTIGILELIINEFLPNIFQVCFIKGRVLEALLIYKILCLLAIQNFNQ